MRAFEAHQRDVGKAASIEVLPCQASAGDREEPDGQQLSVEKGGDYSADEEESAGSTETRSLSQCLLTVSETHRAASAGGLEMGDSNEMRQGAEGEMGSVSQASSPIFPLFEVDEMSPEAVVWPAFVAHHQYLQGLFHVAGDETADIESAEAENFVATVSGISQVIKDDASDVEAAEVEAFVADHGILPDDGDDDECGEPVNH